MSNTKNQNNSAIENLIYGVMLVLFSAGCFFFGHEAFEAVTFGAALHGAKPELIVTAVVWMTAPIAVTFTIGMYWLTLSLKGFDPMNPERVADSAKKFVAAKVIVYQDLSDQACAERILRLSTVKSGLFQAAVKAELTTLNLI